MKDVQIEIVINSAGDFCYAKRLEKPKKGEDKEYSVDTIIPTTVESEVALVQKLLRIHYATI